MLASLVLFTSVVAGIASAMPAETNIHATLPSQGTPPLQHTGHIWLTDNYNLTVGCLNNTGIVQSNYFPCDAWSGEVGYPGSQRPWFFYGGEPEAGGDRYSCHLSQGGYGNSKGELICQETESPPEMAVQMRNGNLVNPYTNMTTWWLHTSWGGEGIGSNVFAKNPGNGGPVTMNLRDVK